ncbi:MAG: hypothetical protein LBM26_04610 [Methanobrevibacter sp.]|jgi:type I restriction enzyme S subunit|nr:hypothetical protein [Methanobrevibacter sp.]
MRIDNKPKFTCNINQNLEQIVELYFQEKIINYFQDKQAKNWKISTLNDLIKISSGKRPLNKVNLKNNEFNILVLGATAINSYTNKFSYVNPILLVGRVGTLGVIQRINFKSFPSDNTLVILSDVYEYVFQMLKRINYEILNIESTQP